MIPSRIVQLELALQRDEVVRFLDYPAGHQPPTRIERLLAEVLREACQLANGRGCFSLLPASQAPELGLEDPGAEGLVLGLVTAGPALERRAHELAQQGQLTRALLLDAAGSAAAEETADRLSALVTAEEGQASSCRISPGYGSWPLQAQPSIFARLPAAELGVELSPSLMMLPRKSISFALWLGAGQRPARGLAGCSRCQLAHCRYRRAPVQPPSPRPREDSP